MLIHSMLLRSGVNGPGERAVVWFQGCDLHCRGCFNPASHPFDHARDKPSQLVLVASNDGHDHSILIHQNVDLHIGSFAAGAIVPHRMKANRFAWVQVAHGELLLKDILLKTGDGAGVSEEEVLEFKVNEPSEVLLIDLA